MNKINDAFTPTVKEYDFLGIKIKLNKLTLNVLAQYEAEGLSINDLMEKVQNQPATWASRIFFDLMTDESKGTFKDLETFRKIISITNIQEMSTILADAMVGSMPKVEAENGAVKKNEGQAQ